MTHDLSWFRLMGPYVQQRECTLYYLALGTPVAGDTSLGERGREAPKSMRMLELIEASANMCRNELECVYMPECSSLLGRGPPPLFIGSRRGGLQVRGVPDVVLLSKNWGEQLVVPVAVHCEVWPRAWLTSLEAFDHAGNVYLFCGVCGRRGNSYRARCPLCLTGRSAEGASNDGLVLVYSCNVSEGRRP